MRPPADAITPAANPSQELAAAEGNRAAAALEERAAALGAEASAAVEEAEAMRAALAAVTAERRKRSAARATEAGQAADAARFYDRCTAAVNEATGM